MAEFLAEVSEYKISSFEESKQARKGNKTSSPTSTPIRIHTWEEIMSEHKLHVKFAEGTVYIVSRSSISYSVYSSFSYKLLVREGDWKTSKDYNGGTSYRIRQGKWTL